MRSPPFWWETFYECANNYNTHHFGSLLAHAQFSLISCVQCAFWFASLRAQQTIESVFALTFGVVSIEPLVVHAC
jgi:hypothetical protein